MKDLNDYAKHYLLCREQKMRKSLRASRRENLRLRIALHEIVMQVDNLCDIYDVQQVAEEALK